LARGDGYSQGQIMSNLYDAAVNAQLPIPVLMDLIRLFSFDVDFQREIQPGDAFEVMYDELRDDRGEIVRSDHIRYAAMILGGKRLEYFRHEPASGRPGYYGPDGQSVRKTLMRTPIDGARLSSRYGRRRHPVSGYTKMHRGVDFAAPRGVPIMAAGDGVIEKIGRWNAYGKYVRIRHNGTFKTAYAHMHRFAKGMRRGRRVKQGEIIGYVGSTGRSTGPHLHYEVLRNGRQTNPMKVKLPSGMRLKGKALKNFNAALPTVAQRVAQFRETTRFASD
jgi:murein DD-endopeptidase MepM/ murein hydrolase activator NlpD